MERRVPSTASEEIELYLQTVYSLLRSSAEVRIRTLEEVHTNMNSSLHPDAHSISPDTSALIYSLLRLPSCMPDVKLVVLGQSEAVLMPTDLLPLKIGNRSAPAPAAAAVISTARILWLASSPAAQTLTISSRYLPPTRSNGINCIPCCRAITKTSTGAFWKKTPVRALNWQSSSSCPSKTWNGCG